MLLLAVSALVPFSAAAPAEVSALLAAVEAHAEHAGPDTCVTPLVAELRARADELTPAQRAWATQALMPWKSDLNARVAPLRATPPPPGAMPTEPCFSIGENRVTSAHFAVEWDGSTITESVAQGFLDSLEEGYTVQVDELGWREPSQVDDYLVLAYVQSGGSMGAYTTVEECGNGFVPYIVAYSGSFSSRSWAETMAVHELNHALQFSYGFAWEFWWWEATATYIEGQVYPTSDWWAYYVDGYSQNPQLAMNASDQNDQDIFWHMYGMAIWANYMSEYLGGPDAVLATWENAVGAGGYYTFGMRDAFDASGLDLDTAYADFVVRNTVMDYDDQDAIPPVDEVAEVDELPASDDVSGNNRPQGYGQSYLRFEAGAGEGDLVVAFDGDPNGQWSVQLVEVSRTEVLRVVTGDIVDGVGTLTMPDFGGEDVMLVASPLRATDDKFAFAWSADLVAPEVLDTAEDTGAPLAGDDDTAGEQPSGCGCASTGDVGGLGLGMLLSVATLARRRRG